MTASLNAGNLQYDAGRICAFPSDDDLKVAVNAKIHFRRGHFTCGDALFAEHFNARKPVREETPCFGGGRYGIASPIGPIERSVVHCRSFQLRGYSPPVGAAL
ncbi:MAG: hypothetical protein ACTHKQ_18080 [Mesorhizobium sp.]